jgi:hypothetical protein
MTISALTKVLGILAVLVILIGMPVYMRKVTTQAPQRAAIQAASTTMVPQPGTDPWIAALAPHYGSSFRIRLEKSESSRSL